MGLLLKARDSIIVSFGQASPKRLIKIYAGRIAINFTIINVRKESEWC